MWEREREKETQHYSLSFENMKLVPGDAWEGGQTGVASQMSFKPVVKFIIAFETWAESEWVMGEGVEDNDGRKK